MRLSARIVIVCVLVSACTARHYTPPATAPQRAPVPVSASFGKSWDAVIDAFADKLVVIHTIDRSSGLIVADPVWISDEDAARGLSRQSEIADCGTVKVSGQALFVGEPGYVTYNVRVRGDSSSSTVLVTTRIVTGLTRHFGAGEECSSKGVWERQFELAVKNKAERR